MTCDFCPWPAVARVTLRPVWRAMLRLPSERRFVCQTHLAKIAQQR